MGIRHVPRNFAVSLVIVCFVQISHQLTHIYTWSENWKVRLAHTAPPGRPTFQSVYRPAVGQSAGQSGRREETASRSPSLELGTDGRGRPVCVWRGVFTCVLLRPGRRNGPAQREIRPPAAARAGSGALPPRDMSLPPRDTAHPSAGHGSAPEVDGPPPARHGPPLSSHGCACHKAWVPASVECGPPCRVQVFPLLRKPWVSLRGGLSPLTVVTFVA